ncbi:MAG: hypothetical protein JSR46_07840, partial [Verrucomicrobia bacterium]|nr:hypothetical protein [Verrucomicrobiota bacterium]
LPAVENEKKELYIDQLIRAKISAADYTKVAAHINLNYFFTGIGLQDVLTRQQLARALQIESQHATMKAHWLFETAAISTATSATQGILGALNLSTKRVIFTIDTSKTFSSIEDCSSFEYNVHLEDRIDNCTSVVFDIDGEINELPSNRSLYLIKKLQEHRPKVYCCVDFVNSLCGRYRGLCELRPIDWHFFPNSSKFSIGDVVGLGDDRQVALKGHIGFEHYALYAGSGLFISLYGSSPIVFSTLEQMKTAYNVKESILMRPF